MWADVADVQEHRVWHRVCTEDKKPAKSVATSPRTLTWFSLSLDLFGRLLSVCCAETSSSKRRSRSFCWPIMRVISSPTRWVSSCAWTFGSTVMDPMSTRLSSMCRMMECTCSSERQAQAWVRDRGGHGQPSARTSSGRSRVSHVSCIHHAQLQGLLRC